MKHNENKAINEIMWKVREIVQETLAAHGVIESKSAGVERRQREMKERAAGELAKREAKRQALQRKRENEARTRLLKAIESRAGVKFAEAKRIVGGRNENAAKVIWAMVDKGQIKAVRRTGTACGVDLFLDDSACKLY